MKTYNDFVIRLRFGKEQAQKASDLYGRPIDSAFSYFARRLRFFANEARKNGVRVIGDDNGYYLALSSSEWEDFKRRRFASFRDELSALAVCERLTVSDMIKNVFNVNVNNPNYELF